MLVCCGVFDEITVFFFEVGHTHCDADQLFTRSSIYLKYKDIWNFDLLCFFLLNSCSLVEFVEMIESLCPWKENIEKYLGPKFESAGIQMYCLLRMKHEGNEGKYQVKRSVHNTQGKWHDYKARDDMCRAVTIDNQPLTAEIFDTFDKLYVIPALPLTDGKELEYRELMNGIQGSAHRIHMAYSDMETSGPIVQSLVNEVNAMGVGRSVPLSWDASMYTNSLRVVVPTILEMSKEERAEYDTILHRKAVNRLHRITNGEP